MTFEVKFDRNEVWIMRAAGLEMDAYQELAFRVLTGKANLPAVVSCPYFLADAPVNVRITIIESGRLQFDVADDGIGHAIQSAIRHYDARELPSVADREREALYESIGEILEPDGVTSEDVEAGKVTLSRRAQEGLKRLCEKVHHTSRNSVYWQFTKCQIPKADRAFAARWLLKRFALEKDPCVRREIGTVFLNHGDLILRELADELMRLIGEPRYGSSRSGLIYALARTRHPQAAEAIASIMEQDKLSWAGLHALGGLRASQYANQVRKYLRDADADLRLEAKRALKKMGCILETPPPPVHLVKSRKSFPQELEEWSANLDWANLSNALKTLSVCVERGFGAQEIAEVTAVAEEMKPNQTKAFQFPIEETGAKKELWVVLFMDDINSPDLYIHGPPEFIEKFNSTFDVKED